MRKKADALFAMLDCQTSLESTVNLPVGVRFHVCSNGIYYSYHDCISTANQQEHWGNDDELDGYRAPKSKDAKCPRDIYHSATQAEAEYRFASNSITKKSH